MYYPQPDNPLDCTDHVYLGLQALCGVQREVQALTSRSSCDTALRPTMFGELRIREGLGHQFANMLSRLRKLDLHITPSEINRAQDQPDLNAVAFLPQLLSRLDGLHHLVLKLITVEDIRREDMRMRSDVSNPDRSQSRPYYTYKHIFPTDMRWRNLTTLDVGGLAIRGMDLSYLVFNQAPFLRRLWLKHIELLDVKWEGLVELFKCRRSWDQLGFQGLFQHCSGKWWPFNLPTTDNDRAEWEFLSDISDYIKHGGRHPSLPDDSSDSESNSYLLEFYRSVDYEQTKELRRRIQDWE